MFKHTYGAADRHNASEIILTSNGISYKYLPCWAKIPKEVNGYEITDMECDSNDTLYVLTRCPEMPIMLFDTEGVFIKSIGKGLFYGRPHGITINSKDELYCTDDTGHVALHISKEGELIRSFGTPNCPSDTGCDRKAFEHWAEKEGIENTSQYDGYFQLGMQIDSIVRSAGPFNGPTSMAEAGDGELYCTDGYGNAAVHHFSEEGTYINSFGTPGKNPGQFRLPHGILIDHNDKIWVADRENNRLQVFSRDGNLIAMTESLFRPTKLCTDGIYVYLSDSDAGFCIFDFDVNLIAQFGFFHSPFCFHGMSVDSKGNLYAATLGKNRFNNMVKLERIE